MASKGKKNPPYPDVIEGVNRQRSSQVVSDMADSALYDFLLQNSKSPGPVTDTTRDLYRSMAINLLMKCKGDEDLEITSDVPSNVLKSGSSGYGHSVTRLDELIYDHPLGPSAINECATDYETSSETSQASSVSTVVSVDDKGSKISGSVYRQSPGIMSSSFPMDPPSVIPKQNVCTLRTISKKRPRPSKFDEEPSSKQVKKDDTLWGATFKKCLVIGTAVAVTLALFYVLWCIKTGTSEADKFEEHELDDVLASME